MPPTPKSRRPEANAVWTSAAVVAIGAVATAIHLMSVLSRADLAQAVLSEGLWRRIIAALGATSGRVGTDQIANVPFAPLLILCGAASLVAWLGGAAIIARGRGVKEPDLRRKNQNGQYRKTGGGVKQGG